MKSHAPATPPDWRRRRRTTASLVVVICAAVAAASSSSPASAASPPHYSAASLSPSGSTSLVAVVVGELRGGGDGAAAVDQETSGGRKQKRKSKSSKKSAVAGECAEDGAAASDDDDQGSAYSSSAKDAIDDAMRREPDMATLLGDAIRDRADVLRRDRLPRPEERALDAALVSLGLALGTAGTDSVEEENGGGGEEIDALAYYQYGHRGSGALRARIPLSSSSSSSSSSSIANYLLETHGGTHLIQLLLSALASTLAAACLALPAFPSPSSLLLPAQAGAAATTTATVDARSLSRAILRASTRYQLMQRALLVAVARHSSALVGAVLIGASSVPAMGFRSARRHLEAVASDPVGQYLFYCSLLAVWMGWFGGSGTTVGMGEYLAGLKGSVISVINAATASASTGGDASDVNKSQGAATISQLLDALTLSPPPWFVSKAQGGSVIPFLVLGPVLLREVSSILWAFSDVLALLSTRSRVLSGMLAGSRSVLDAFMSVLIASEEWRKADSFRRQRALAKLMSRCTLAMELAVGVILVVDALLAIWAFAFAGLSVTAVGGSSGGRPPFKCILGKVTCAHLYLNFLLSRKRKVATALGSVRGGGVFDCAPEGMSTYLKTSRSSRVLSKG